MSILDINQKSKKWKTIKIILVYLAVSLLCIAVNKIYATFGHGVSSDAMTWMFLYPLMGGILFLPLSGIVIPKVSRVTGHRAFFNIYNSGIAMLTAGSFLKGIMEIAGTSSKYVVIYYQMGWSFIVFAFVLGMIHRYSKSHDIV